MQLQVDEEGSKHQYTTDYLKMDALVILSSMEESDLKKSLDMISKTRIKTSLLVLFGNAHQTDMIEFKNLISQLSENMYFYLHYKYTT